MLSPISKELLSSRARRRSMFEELKFEDLALLPLVDNLTSPFEREMKEGTIRLGCLAIQRQPGTMSPRFVRGFLDVDLTFPAGAMFIPSDANSLRERYRKLAVVPGIVCVFSFIATVIAAIDYYRHCDYLFGGGGPYLLCEYGVFNYYAFQWAGSALIVATLWLAVLSARFLSSKLARTVSTVSMPKELESFIETVKPLWRAALDLSQPQRLKSKTAQSVATNIVGSAAAQIFPFPYADQLIGNYADAAVGLTRAERVAAALQELRRGALIWLYDGHRRATARLPSMLGVSDIEAGSALEPESVLVLDPESLQSSILWYRDVSGDVAIPLFPGIPAISDASASS